jgi:signal transduction histidine kinase
MAVRRSGGTGLGLAIARKLVHAHGGSLTLDTGPSGTCARMTLPREVPAD